MDVVFHRLFQRDLNAAIRYYDSEGGRDLGDRFFSELEVAVGKVIENPRRFHFAAEDLRRVSLRKFPYHVLFEENPTRLKFLVLRHDRRHPSYGVNRR
jgi:plasmid stabilization system protein ParE